jgi:hypothetical protein
MTRIFLTLVFLLGLHYPSAYSQVPGGEIVLVAPYGCKIYHRATDTVTHAQLRNVNETGVGQNRCPEKLYDGHILYGVGWKLRLPDGSTKEFIGMRAGWLTNGRFVGLRLAINQGGRLFVLGENGQTILQTGKEASDYSLAKILQVVNTETVRLEALDKNFLARFNVDWLRDVLVRWDQDPYGMMKEYTDDISRSFVANPNSRAVDDPLTLGRGARGG